MLVSIIVPVYNVEKYLGDCIESILRQSFNDFELILIDDGSTDESGNICDTYEKKDDRIIVIHQANQGQSKTRNNGISIAKGEYIVFIDSDDFVFPHYLEILYTECVKAEADLAICGFCRCAETCRFDNLNEDVEYISNEHQSDKMDFYFKSSRIDNTVWGKLYKTSLLEGFQFPCRKYCEDVYSTYITIHNASKIVWCDYKGYVYRNNLTSVMNERYSSQKKDGIYVNIERALFVEQFYPHLRKYAYRGIVYSCNQVLLCMGRSRINEKESLHEIQSLYRKYLFSYLRCKSSIVGKMFATLSFINVRFGLLLARCL